VVQVQGGGENWVQCGRVAAPQVWLFYFFIYFLNLFL
jgi:hypothetical protein